jgi:hypothetical protein
MGYLYEACDQISDFASYRYTISWEAFLDLSDSYFLFADFVDFSTHWTYMLIFRRIFLSNYWWMFNVYRNQLSRQTGSRNLTGPKTFPTIWHTYMKLVTKYQIPVINSCWEKCDEKCAYTNDYDKCLTYICICKFFVTFFSATIDGRNLIFGHNLHIGTPYQNRK